MHIAKVARYTVHRLWASLEPEEGEDVLFQANYGSGRRYRASSILAVWRFTPELGWLLTSCQLTGLLMKKDGELSTRTGHRDYQEQGKLTDDAPPWLRSLIADHAPSGVVLQP